MFFFLRRQSVAVLVLAVAGFFQTVSAGQPYAQVGKGQFGASERGLFDILVEPNTNYQIKVIPTYGLQKYKVSVLNSESKYLGSNAGTGTIYVRFLNTGGSKATVEVATQEATGTYRVYLRQLKSIQSSDDLNSNITGNYNVVFSDTKLNGTASFTQTGSQVEASGTIKNRGAGRSYWSASGTIVGQTVKLNYSLGAGDAPTKGEMDLTVDLENYQIVGSVVTGGKKQSVTFTPISTAVAQDYGNISGTYTIDLASTKRLNGRVRIEQKGTSVSIESSGGKRARWTWSGEGTYDGQNLRFDFTDSKGSKGTAVLVRQKTDTFEGDYSRTANVNTVHGKVTLKRASLS